MQHPLEVVLQRYGLARYYSNLVAQGVSTPEQLATLEVSEATLTGLGIDSEKDRQLFRAMVTERARAAEEFVLKPGSSVSDSLGYEAKSDVDIEAFITSLGLAKYAKCFADHEIGAPLPNR
jgi:hypothetical protein